MDDDIGLGQIYLFDGEELVVITKIIPATKPYNDRIEFYNLAENCMEYDYRAVFRNDRYFEKVC